MRMELLAAGLASLAAFACFSRLPDAGDGNVEETIPSRPSGAELLKQTLIGAALPLRDSRFRRFLAIYFLYCSGNLFYMGTVAPYFARSLGYGYLKATLFIHIVPAVAAFIAAGRLTAWFDRTSIWIAYSAVMLLWGLDPVLLAAGALWWPLLLAARISRGPGTVGGMVLTVYTGVHRFAPPGPYTSCYTSALYFVNAIARLASPIAAALLSSRLSHPQILLMGGSAVLLASALFLHTEYRERASVPHP